MSRVVLEGKPVGETENVTFDFTSRLGTAETISTKSVSATVYSGTDASPSAIVNGSATSSGAVVTQSITAGTLGVTYLLVCTITTSLSQTLELSAFLVVVPDSV